MKALKLIISEHRTYRKQLVKLTKANLTRVYRGSAFGWAWAIVKPIVTIFVFWFAFSYGLRAGGAVNGYPFFLWLIAGFLPWFYMQTMITSGAVCIRANTHMVTKMKFPISVIPTFVSLSRLFVNACLTIVVVLIFAISGHFPDAYYLQIPLFMAMMFLFFTAWGLFAGMLSAISKDFYNLVKSFTTALFWMSGIIYDVNSIGVNWIKAVLNYNPITIIATGYRHCFIDKVWIWEDPTMIRCYIIVTFIMLAVACWAYGKLYKEVPDVL